MWDSVHQTLRYMAVAQSITIRVLFFQPDRYKCSKCGQLKFEHCLAFAAQERNTEDMIDLRHVPAGCPSCIPGH